MNYGLFWRSLLVQAGVVVALFAVLLALPLGDDFFADYGFLIGPVSWAACSLATARILSLPARIALLAALAGGVAGALVGLALGHAAGLALGLLVFAASCAAHDAEQDAAAA